MSGGRLERTKPRAISRPLWSMLLLTAAVLFACARVPTTACASDAQQHPVTTLIASCAGVDHVDLADWFNEDVVITLMAADHPDGSGTVNTFYTLDGGLPVLYVLPVEISAEGATTITYWSIGQEGEAEPAQEAIVRVDTTPPITTSNAAVPADYLYDGSNSKPSISLMASDDHAVGPLVSGVAYTEWRVDGGVWRQGTTIALNNSLAGRRMLEYRSVDVAGNVEQARAIPLTLYRRYEDYGWFGNEGVNLQYRGSWRAYSDSVSLSASRMKYTKNVGASAHFDFIGTGFRLQAPRSEWGGIAEIYIDDLPPFEVDFYDPEPPVRMTPEAVFDIEGLEPGVHSVRIVATGRGNDPAGSHFIFVDAVDVLGVLTPDIAPPVTVIDYDDEPYQTSSTVTMTAHDKSTWVSATYYRLNGSQSIEYTGPFTVSDEGRHAIEYWSVDGVGNVEGPKSATLTVGVPVCGTSATLVPGDPDGSAGWFRTRPSVVVTAVPDAHCEGEPRSYLCVGDGAWEESYGPVPVLEGDHVYRFYSRAGDSVSGIDSMRVAFDETAPTRPESPRIVYTTGTACMVAWDASADAASGVDHYRVYRDGSLEGTISGTAYRLGSLQPQTEYVIGFESVDVAGNSSAEATMVITTAMDGQSLSPVPEGSNVRVDLPDGGIMVFDHVTSSGVVRIMPIEPRGGPTSSLFRIVHGVYYQIEVDATFVGKVTMTLPYDETRLDGWQSANQSQRDAIEKSLKFLHRTASGGWENITDHVDTVNNTITGTTTSFSDFWMESVAARRIEIDSRSTRLTRFGDSYVFTGKLVDDATGVPIADAQVRLQSSFDGVRFSEASRAATTSADGTFSFLVKPLHKMHYRVVAEHAGIANLYTTSGSRWALPRASVGTPVAPKTVSRGRAAKVYGALKPRHKSGSRPVTLRIERWAAGRWVKHASSAVRVSDYSNHSRYARSVTFQKAGRYRMRASHPECDRHAFARSSKWRYITVK